MRASLDPSRPSTAADARRGLTLIETMAALLLLAIALPVAMRGVSLATAASDSARRRGEAAALAQSKLAQIMVNQDWKRGSLSGDFAAEWSDYRWDSIVGDWTFKDLRQVDVNVSWDARGRRHTVTLSTLVYDPPEDKKSSGSTGSGAATGGGT